MVKRIYYILKQRIFQIKNSNKPCEGKVYMFHDVGEKGGLYSISKDNFNEFLNWLIENKKIVTIDELKNNLSQNNVVLTFDDVFSSVYRNAYPILSEKKIPYYIFLCNDFIEKEEFVSKEEVSEMIKNSNCILGCHRYYHELSRNVDDNNLNNELIKAKNELQEMFNVSIRDFAFPYGSMYACSKENIEVANRLFDNIFMTYNLSYNHQMKNIMSRININNNNYKEEMK